MRCAMASLSSCPADSNSFSACATARWSCFNSFTAYAAEESERRLRLARAELARPLCEARRPVPARLVLLLARRLALSERECELPRPVRLPPPLAPRVRLAEREPVFDCLGDMNLPLACWWVGQWSNSCTVLSGGGRAVGGVTGGERDAIASCILGIVERFVCAVAQGFQSVVRLAHGDADRQRHGADVLHSVVAGDDRAGGAGADLFGERGRIVEGPGREEHRELVAAQAR